jgi:FKBP-type peptidyl-prolyl cis-trans isomerase 2
VSDRIPSGNDSSLLTNVKVTTLLIVALLVSIVTIGYVTATSNSVGTELYPFVDIGDMVYVEYVGYFPTHPGGWIFDTNKRTIGLDDSLTKSLFNVKRDAKDYTPINFSAGTAKNLLKPFVDGVVGMMVTQTKNIYISAEDGYPIDSEGIVHIPLILIAPVKQNLTVTQFKTTYGEYPVLGMVKQHYFWEWDTRVIGIEGDKIIMQSEPYLGQTISSYGNPESDPRDGWYQKVVGINASADGGIGQVKVQNFITAQDIYQKKGQNYDESMSALRWFTLIDVDEAKGEFTIIYNADNYVGELAGRPLYFEVTVTKIIKAR